VKVLTHPHPILKRKSATVDEREFGPELTAHLDRMVATMEERNGRGLASVQVGDARRIVLLRTEEDEPRVLRMVNPTIVKDNGVPQMTEEGCLSYPGLDVYIERPNGVEVQWTDEEGNFQSEWFYGINAVAAQHEIDHLDGVTIYTRTRRTTRRKYDKAWKKAKKK
jgi:peptide deformylase